MKAEFARSKGVAFDARSTLLVVELSREYEEQRWDVDLTPEGLAALTAVQPGRALDVFGTDVETGAVRGGYVLLVYSYTASGGVTGGRMAGKLTAGFGGAVLSGFGRPEVGGKLKLDASERFAWDRAEVTGEEVGVPLLEGRTVLGHAVANGPFGIDATIQAAADAVAGVSPATATLFRTTRAKPLHNFPQVATDPRLADHVGFWQRLDAERAALAGYRRYAEEQLVGLTAEQRWLTQLLATPAAVSADRRPQYADRLRQVLQQQQQFAAYLEYLKHFVPPTMMQQAQTPPPAAPAGEPMRIADQTPLVAGAGWATADTADWPTLSVPGLPLVAELRLVRTRGGERQVAKAFTPDEVRTIHAMRGTVGAAPERPAETTALFATGPATALAAVAKSRSVAPTREAATKTAAEWKQRYADEYAWEVVAVDGSVRTVPIGNAAKWAGWKPGLKVVPGVCPPPTGKLPPGYANDPKHYEPGHGPGR